jgi:hypothetical protein
MLIHLESGNCSSGADLAKIEKLAYQCYQARKYTTDFNDPYPYECPNCDTIFRFPSALFQHVETTPACQDYLEQPECLAKLRRWIAVRVNP